MKKLPPRTKRAPRRRPPSSMPENGSTWSHKVKGRQALVIRHGRPRGDSTYVYYRQAGSLALTLSCASMEWFLRNYNLVMPADPAGV